MMSTRKHSNFFEDFWFRLNLKAVHYDVVNVLWKLIQTQTCYIVNTVILSGNYISYFFYFSIFIAL